jgi:hypothetical protein
MYCFTILQEVADVTFVMKISTMVAFNVRTNATMINVLSVIRKNFPAKQLLKSKSLRINCFKKNNLSNYCWEIRNCPSVLQTMYCFIIQIGITGVIFVTKTTPILATDVLQNAIMMYAPHAIRRKLIIKGLIQEGIWLHCIRELN